MSATQGALRTAQTACRLASMCEEQLEAEAAHGITYICKQVCLKLPQTVMRWQVARACRAQCCGIHYLHRLPPPRREVSSSKGEPLRRLRPENPTESGGAA